MSASGPQEERLSKYGKEADLRYPDARDDLRGPAFASREEATRTQINRMQTTIEHLQQMVQRQEIVINDYQTKYPGAVAAGDLPDTSLGQLPPWVSDPHIMSPLLLAYDERIRELHNAQQTSTQQVENMKKMNSELSSENTDLRADLKNYVEKLYQTTQDGLGGSVTSVGGLAQNEHLSELTEMNEVLNQTNGIMSDQIAMLEDHLNKSRKQLSACQAELSKETKRAQEQQVAVTQLSVMNRSLRLERDQTARRLQASIAENASLQQERDTLQSLVRETGQGTRAKDTKIQELEAAIVELNKVATADQDSLEARIHELIDRERELKAKLIASDSTLDASRDDLRAVQQELSSTRSDAEGMVKVMTALEKQLAEYASREEQTMQIAKEAKEKVEQAMLERDQARAREAQSRREIARLLEQRRNQAVEAMGAQEEAVGEMRARMKDQLQQREETIVELGSRCTALQASVERATREKQSAESERRALLEEVNAERKRLRETITDFASRTKESVERRDRAEAQMQATLQDLAEKEHEMALHKSELEDRLTHSDERLSTVSKQLSIRTADLKRAEADLRQCRTEIAQLRSENTKVQQEAQKEINKSHDVTTRQVAELQSQLDMAKRTFADGQAQSAALLAAQDRRFAKARSDFEESQTQLQRMLREKGEECRRATSRAVQLEQQLMREGADKHSLDQQLGQLAQELEEQISQRKTYQSKQREAASRMAGLVADQEKRLATISELRMEVDRLKRELQRRGRGMVSAS